VDELCTVEMFLQMWKLLSLSISPQGGAVHTTKKQQPWNAKPAFLRIPPAC